MLFQRKSRIKFVGRAHSKRGIISMLLGLLTLGTFITVSFLSGIHRGDVGLWLGAIGMAAFAVAIAGFMIGIKSFKEKDIFYVAPILGVGLNGIMTVTLFCLYIVGIVV